MNKHWSTVYSAPSIVHEYPHGDDGPMDPELAKEFNSALVMKDNAENWAKLCSDFEDPSKTYARIMVMEHQMKDSDFCFLVLKYDDDFWWRSVKCLLIFAFLVCFSDSAERSSIRWESNSAGGSNFHKKALHVFVFDDREVFDDELC